MKLRSRKLPARVPEAEQAAREGEDDLLELKYTPRKIRSRQPQPQQQQKGGELYRMIGSVLLILVSPPLAFALCYTAVALDGSLSQLWDLVQQLSAKELADRVVFSHFEEDEQTWLWFSVFVSLQALLMLCIPGELFLGPQASDGYVPIHKLNGFASFVITMVLFEVAALDRASLRPYLRPYLPEDMANLLQGEGPVLVSGSFLYDNVLAMLGVATCFAFLVSLYLFLSAPDHAIQSASVPFVFYWGAELYPRIGPLQIKLLLHSRVGMTLWALLNVSYLHAQPAHSGSLSNAMLLNAGLQLLYIAHHHWWEKGYVQTTDIVHDHEGFYLIYGCVAFMPFTFTLSGMTLVQNSTPLSGPACVSIVILCLLANYVNFSTDAQKMYVRQADGVAYIWGEPATVIAAPYSIVIDGHEKTRTSFLLVCGWWQFARHLHYFADLIAVLCWTLPAASPLDCPLVYFYLVFLASIFVDRAKRDDVRCKKKYGKYWDTYCEMVPYRIVPYVW